MCLGMVVWPVLTASLSLRLACPSLLSFLSLDSSDWSVPTGLGEGLTRGFQSLYVHLPGGHQWANHP